MPNQRYIAIHEADGKHIISVKLIGDIPDDYASKNYFIGAIDDPDNPGFPVATWLELTGGATIGGYGNNYGGSYG